MILNACHCAAAAALLAAQAPLAFGGETSPAKMLYQFRQKPPPTAWRVVNDDVMGGVSRSRFVVTNQVGLFTGIVSLENNGGFASVRTRPGRHDCGGFDGLRVRVRGDGHRYKLSLRTDDRFDGVYYQVGFETRANQWEEHWLAFQDFQPTYRGRVLTDARPLDPARITSVGFLIADKQAGPFRLEIQWIQATGRDPEGDR